MLEKRHFHKLCAEKPDLFGALPDIMLSQQTLEELRSIPRVAVGEMHGSGRFDALYNILSHYRPDAFVPTIAYTGTEYGLWDGLYRACKKFTKTVEIQLHIYCTDPVILGAPSFWRALNGAYETRLRRCFKMPCMCLGCRLYACAVRIPLCKTIDAHSFIWLHDGQYNGCGVPGGKELYHYCRIFMKGFGIELIADASQNQTTDALYSPQEKELPLLQCIIAHDTNDPWLEQRAAPGFQAKFFEGYAIPAVAHIVSKTLSGVKVDYVQ
ncbi:MAG: hypothetical protein N3B18_02980, partial [Desulfobacterota bacterium]|nr:hypothetical protein [Thermodesulfobacteriota bacterium]